MPRPAFGLRASTRRSAIRLVTVAAPVFDALPAIMPGTGAVGTTFTATDGVIRDGALSGRRWLLDGTAIGSTAMVTPATAGTLVLENSASGPGGSATAISAAVAVTAPLIGTINAEGWSAEWAGGTPPTFTPDTAPQTFRVTRAGYDATGAQTTYSTMRTATRRKRQPYPNHAGDTARTVALDDYVYTTDTIAGVTNNATETSPKPIAAWTMMGQLLVGASVFWEIAAFHRDFRAGRQVACVRVRANDGTHQSAWQTVATPALSTYCEDANPIETFSGTLSGLDSAGFADGALFWLEAEIYPWIGGAAAVLRSEDAYAAGAAAREFTRRYFYKDTARFANPPLAYVRTGGSDTAGVWSTSDAAAYAAPFATVKGALDRIDATSPVNNAAVTGGYVDGCTIFVSDTAALGSSAVNRAQKGAALRITRDPRVPRSAAVVTLATAWSPKLGGSGTSLLAPLSEGALLLEDITVNRTANVAITGATAANLRVLWRNVAVSNAGIAGKMVATGSCYHYGTVVSGAGGIPGHFSGGTTAMRILRGVVANLANGGTAEAWWTFGSTLTAVKGCYSADATKGAIWYGNKYLSPDATTAPIQLDAANAGETVAGMVVVQNLVEVTHTTASTPALRGPSSDAPQHGNSVQAILAHNTITGYGSVGRANLFYDSNAGTEVRAHRLMRDVGNIYVQLNSKGDVFVGGSGGDPTNAPAHIGQLAYHHGVGCQGNISQYAVNAATPLSEYQAYPGLGAKIGASASAAQFTAAAIWTNYQGTSGAGGVATAGAGGGGYTLAAGSPARGIVSRRGLSFDLAGAARSASDSAGAYA